MQGKAINKTFRTIEAFGRMKAVEGYRKVQEAKKTSDKMGWASDVRWFQKHSRISEDQREANQTIRLLDTKADLLGC
jgi:hypothetical protein